MSKYGQKGFSQDYLIDTFCGNMVISMWLRILYNVDFDRKLLILLNYTPACTYSLHAPMYLGYSFIRHFLVAFLIQCSTV